MLDPNLLDAYHHTDYFINLGSQWLCLRINEYYPALDPLLREYRCNAAALLSADNPRSLLLNDEQNRQRRQQLDAELQQRQLTWFDGFNRAQRGDWPDEDSRLVLGVCRADAEALARQFEQHGFLFLEPQQAIQLHLLDVS